MPASSSRVSASSVGSLDKTSVNDRLELIAVGGAAGVALEPRVARELRTVQHRGREGRPFAVVLQPEQHGAVGSPVGSIRIDGGMAGAVARRRLGAVHGEVHRKAHPFGHRLQHRHVDVVPGSGAAALDQRGQDRGDRRSRRRRCRRSRCRPWPSRPWCRSPTGIQPPPGSAGRRPCARPSRRLGRSRRSSSETRRGNAARSACGPRPSRSAAPGARFCTNTSARARIGSQRGTVAAPA